MMRAAFWSLVLLWIVIPGAALAQDDALCSTESGTANHLCREFCGALTCHLAGDDDPNTEPRGSARDCDRIAKRFERLTGRQVSCERKLACPCMDPESWADSDVGTTWEDFASEVFNREDTTCDDGGNRVVLKEKNVEFDSTGAGVDLLGPECLVWDDGIGMEPVTLPVTEREARACRRILRQAGGSLCR